ncbi:unnamed protein product, partial [Staurois parvus]
MGGHQCRVQGSAGQSTGVSRAEHNGSELRIGDSRAEDRGQQGGGQRSLLAGIGQGSLLAGQMKGVTPGRAENRGHSWQGREQGSLLAGQRTENRGHSWQGREQGSLL